MNYFTVEEFAKEMGICTSTVRQGIKLGKINGFRPGSGKRSAFRIPKTELERLQVMKDYPWENQGKEN